MKPHRERFRLAYFLVFFIAGALIFGAFVWPGTPSKHEATKPPKAHYGVATLSPGEGAQLRSAQTFERRPTFYIRLYLGNRALPFKQAEPGCVRYAVPELKAGVCAVDERGKLRVIGVAQNTGTRTERVTIEYGYDR